MLYLYMIDFSNDESGFDDLAEQKVIYISDSEELLKKHKQAVIDSQLFRLDISDIVEYKDMSLEPAARELIQKFDDAGYKVSDDFIITAEGLQRVYAIIVEGKKK